MTDADLLSRINAHDWEGRQVAWTPEAVGLRLVEAYRVMDRTPISFGPKSFGTAWPGAIVMSWEDLIDEKDKQRLMAAYGGEVDWERWVDEKTIRQLSRDRANEAEKRMKRSAPTAAQYSRAEEAIRWPAVYLVDQPLLADAISTFSACRGLKRSLDAHMKERRRAADELIGIARAASKERKRGTGRMRLVEIGTLELTRQSLFPGRNFDTAALYARRKVAMEIVCAGLVAARVVLRLADDDESAAPDTE